MLNDYILEYEAYRTMLSTEKVKAKKDLISKMMVYIASRIEALKAAPTTTLNTNDVALISALANRTR